MAAKYCIKCGAQLYEDAAFCAQCGFAVPVLSPEEESQTTTLIELPRDEQAAGSTAPTRAIPSDAAETHAIPSDAAETRVLDSDAFETQVIPADAAETQLIGSNVDATQVMHFPTDEQATELISETPAHTPQTSFAYAPDLSGFDVEAGPHYDYEDDGLGDGAPDWSNGPIDWSTQRPAGWTGGMQPQETMQMPPSANPMQGVSFGTEQMSAIDANIPVPHPYQAVYASEAPQKRSRKGLIIGIVIVALILAGLYYIIVVNPYVFQNMLTLLKDWCGEEFARTLGGVAQNIRDFVLSLLSQGR